MEVYFSATPKFEPIAHRPFIRKWVREKTFVDYTNNGHDRSPFLNHINKYLYHCLEKNNLELAYKFRYSLEVAGYLPFYRRRIELDKALRRARNGSYALLETLIDSICVEVDDLTDRKQRPAAKQQLADRWDRRGELSTGKDEKGIRISGDLLSELQSNKALVLPEPTDWMQEYAILYEWHLKKLVTLGNDQLDAAFHRKKDNREVTPADEMVTKPSFTIVKVQNPLKPPTIRDCSPIEQITEDKNEVSYDFTGFKLAKDLQKADGEIDESVVFLEGEEVHLHRSNFVSPGLANDSKKSRTQKRPELFPSQQENRKPKYSVPPPLYKFKAIAKSSVTKAYEDEEPKDPLVISQDSITRRITESQEQNHFLEGSAFWDTFRKSDNDGYGYNDANSLVINQDCIDNRISNLKVNQAHALSASEDEYKAFEAFDSLFIHPEDPVDEDQEAWDEAEAEEREFDNVAYRKTVKQLYQKSLRCYQKGDHTYFDLSPSRFAETREGNAAIYQWLQQISLTVKELFSAFREGMNQAKTDHFGEVQDFLVSRLKRSDFPSYEAWTHFETYANEMELEPLVRNNLVHILSNETDRIGAVTGCGSEALQNLFTAITDEPKEEAEIPTIQVRISELSRSAPFLPIQKPTHERAFLDSPKFNVRTSSAYQKSHALTGGKKPFVLSSQRKQSF